ncbi:MAG: transcriptional regulator [Clostridiales bacterium]|jgi:hypothetical protein|nr:transcriptional regulator [Clostridiales bacterium]
MIASMVAAFFGLVVLQMMMRGKRPVQYALGGIGMGLCALAAVNLTGWLTGVTLPLSLMSLGVSAAGGIPGVTTMLVLNLFFV